MIHRILTAVLLNAVLLTVFSTLPAAGGGTPFTAVSKSLLKQYAEEARKRNPAFSGFDASRGRTLYVSKHKAKDGMVRACATCHMPDPTKEGRSDVGKTLAPLSPAVNPKRFTDAEEVEKWFRRNCRDVLSRICTPMEKGDFITFLFSRK